MTTTTSSSASIIRPFSEFNNDHKAYVDYIRDVEINADTKTWIQLHRVVADYVNYMIPDFEEDHNDLVADFQNHEFSNDEVDFDWLLDNVRKTYTVEELTEQLKQSGMNKREIDMVLATIYEENFLMLIGGEGHLFLNIRFREYNKNHATKILTLYWRDGFFFTQVPPM